MQKTKTKPKAADLLTLDDLVERWGWPVSVVKKAVRGNIPFFQPDSTSLRINWELARFRLEAVQEWERNTDRPAKRTTATPRQAAATPAVARPKKPWDY